MSRLSVPIFPLNTVLFPGGLLPLRVFEARYMDMTRECLKHDKPFGVCLIQEGKEVGDPAVPQAVGCLATITEWDMQQPGVLNLKTRGGQRFRILGRETNTQGLISADIEMIPPDESVAVPEEFAVCAQLLQLVVAD
ncbi:MAG: LON peptidase substrate-binding domain-containing protein [Burkholderiales bacterium]